MATGGKLEVQIGADITDFEKKIKEVEYDIKELSKVKLDKIRLGLDTREINAQIKDAKNSLTGLKTAVKDTGGQIGGQFTKQVGNGSNTLMQFSRIAQDAPFGIMGIGNNITATAESFGYLKQQTGSTSGALKAMASSLMGTGGILLGVSLLTTGLTLLAQSGLSVGDVINKITGQFDEFGNTLNKLSIDAAKNSGQEIAGVKALVSVAQDELKTRQDRLTAVEELQNKYPGYFGNLTKEKILSGDLTEVTKELSKAIIARAEATAIADKIGELASKKLDLQIKKEKEVLKLQQAQAGVKNKVVVTGGTLGASGDSFSAGRLAASTSKVKDLNQEIYEIQVQQDRLAGRLNQKESDAIKLLEKKVSIKKEKEVKVFDTPQVAPLESSLLTTGLVAKPIDFTALTDSVKNVVPQIKLGFSEIEFALYDFNQSASEIINGGLVDTFAGIGTAIGTALSTGGNLLQALGASLLSSLGGVLTQMGKMAIEIGVGLLGVKLALKTLNPYAAIAAGVGLIALGALFSSKSASIGGSMGGSGGGQTSTSTGSGANNNTSTSGGGYGWSGGGTNTVVFEIAGTSLIGVLNNTTSRNLRIGGR